MANHQHLTRDIIITKITIETHIPTALPTIVIPDKLLAMEHAKHAQPT